MPLPPRRSTLSGLAAGLSLAAVAASVPPAEAAPGVPPNVLLIVADDAARSDLGCYGGRLATPNLDRLAAEGTRFTRADPASTVCTPSRYSLLTGRYASTADSLAERTPPGEPASITWNTFLDEDDTAIGEVFEAAGRRTGFVGKWHLGEPRQWHFPEQAWPDDPDYAGVLSENARIRAEAVRRLGGFDDAASIYSTNVRWMSVPKVLMGHHQHHLTHLTNELVEEYAGPGGEDRPPWLLVHSTTIHHPPDVAEALRTQDPRATLEGFSEEHLGVQPGYEDLLERTAAYGPFDRWEQESETAGTLWLDDAVGAMLAQLESTGQLDETVIVFVSDHGREGKFVLNGGRVPLIIRYPARVPAGEVCDALVSLLDLFPTLLDLGEVPRPEGLTLDGVSLVPLLDGSAEEVREAAYMEVTHTRAAVTPRFKYIATRFPERVRQRIDDAADPAAARRRVNQEGRANSFGDADGGFVRYGSQHRFPGYFDDNQLYDLALDPEEQTNVADDPDYAETLPDMKAHLQRLSQASPLPFGEFSGDDVD